MSEFDYRALDDIIHSRIRLAIMALLASVEHAEFSYLRDEVRTTDGNLGTHLRKLEDAGYVTTSRGLLERRPVSRYQLTDTGRQALTAYVDRLEGLLAPAR